MSNGSAATPRHVVLKRVSFVGWLGILYVILLYVSVGALGVSEVSARYGNRAAEIFHIVSVFDMQREQDQDDLEHLEARRSSNAQGLSAAVDALRKFGVGQGLSLAKIQPVIDGRDNSPRLAELLGRDVGTANEEKWAGLAYEVVRLQDEGKRLEADIEARLNKLSATWASKFKHEDAGGAAPANGERGDGKEHALSAIDLESAAGTAATLRRLGYGALFLLPREILTLVLALTMGGLGATLQVTKTLVDGVRVENASYYIVRPFQGMVTALVMYVLLKAGQLTITSTDGAISLNNYFVAFASIIAGLMSQQAYRVIENAGAALLKSDGGESRWAFKLKDYLAAAQAAPEQLAAGIGANPAEVLAWIDEKQEVPATYQRLISVWLRVPERELFTSQPPDRHVAAAPAAAGASPATTAGEAP